MPINLKNRRYISKNADIFPNIGLCLENFKKSHKKAEVLPLTGKTSAFSILRLSEQPAKRLSLR